LYEVERNIDWGDVHLNKYESLQQEAVDNGLGVLSWKFDSNKLKGLIYDNTIVVSDQLPDSASKTCILAEEIGHYYTASGNILDMSSVINRKQEHLGRMWAYNKLIGLIGIIDAFEHGCQSKFEIAEYLDVTEDFLSEAISAYRAKYGVYKIIDNYVIYFIPNLSVVKFLG